MSRYHVAELLRRRVAREAVYGAMRRSLAAAFAAEISNVLVLLGLTSVILNARYSL